MLFFCLSAFAQDTCRSELGYARNLDYLASGVLLVRLHTKEITIEKLEQQGFFEEAKRVEAHQRSQNLELMDAFQEEFDYCPVQYFSSSDSEYILSGDFDKLEFLNERLEKDTSIHFPRTGFLIAEMGNVSFAGSNSSFEALMIRDQCLIQMKQPFPFFAKTWKILKFNTTAQVVSNLNKKLSKARSKSLSY